MPPRRTRGAANTEAAVNETPKEEVPEAVQDNADDSQNGEPPPNNNDTMEHANSNPLPQSDLKETSVQVNGKPAPKSAAAKKREKRKQRKREGSIVSEISDTESVLSFSGQYSPAGIIISRQQSTAKGKIRIHSRQYRCRGRY